MDDDESNERQNKIAMQTRCPTCLGEQYGLNVIGFSEGRHGCSVCGATTTPMSDEQWYAALSKARDAR